VVSSDTAYSQARRAKLRRKAPTPYSFRMTRKAKQSSQQSRGSTRLRGKKEKKGVIGKMMRDMLTRSIWKGLRTIVVRGFFGTTL
jgi:hypothetical protein